MRSLCYVMLMLVWLFSLTKGSSLSTQLIPGLFILQMLNLSTTLIFFFNFLILFVIACFFALFCYKISFSTLFFFLFWLFLSSGGVCYFPAVVHGLHYKILSFLISFDDLSLSVSYIHASKRLQNQKQKSMSKSKT